MNNNIPNIDQILKEKFDNFSPTPPEHIWKTIEDGLNKTSIIPFYKNKWIIAASIFSFVAIVSTLVIFNPLLLNKTESSSNLKPVITESTIVNSQKSESIINHKVVDDVTIINNTTNETIQEVSEIDKQNIIIEEIVSTKILKPETAETNIAHTEIVEVQPVYVTAEQSSSNIQGNAQYFSQSNEINLIELKKSAFVTELGNADNYNHKPRNEAVPIPNIDVLQPEKTIVNSHWKVGSYLSPELAISEFDSVEILSSYTFSIEPTYYINDNWFMRFGAGISYVRDRGFAKIDYISNDYMGSYDDVYDITFDTTSGNITPIYHTKTVEVWDSVEHVSVSNVTNQYTYLQLPLLFGYQHKKQGSNFSWYIMGGPAFNLKVTENIDDPKPQQEDAEIISLQNNLPTRSGNYMQLWLGAGIEYQLNNKISLAVEPGYRYYFKSIYSKPYNSTSSAGVTLRVGLVYTIK